MNELIVSLIRKNDLQEFINNTNNITHIDQAIYSIEISDGYTRKNADNQEKNLPSTQLTLLHVAAYYDSLEIFFYLNSTKGMPIGILSGHSFLPLHYACWNGSEEVASFILTNDQSEATFFTPFPSPLQLLYCATRGQDIDILNNLFKYGSNLSDERNYPNDVINLAILLGKKEIVECLHAHYKISNNNPNESYWNLPMKAVLTQNVDAFNILYSGSNDLFVCEHNSGTYISLIDLICRHDNTNKKFKSILLEILNKNSHIILEPPYKGPGLCHWACTYHDLDVTKAMLKIVDFKINRLDSDGKSGPSCLTGENGKIDCDILRLLIDNGFDVNVQKNPSLLETFVCGFYKRPDMVQLLVENGADIFAVSTKTDKDKKNLTIYDYVMSRRQRNNEFKTIFKNAKENIDKKQANK